MQKTSKTNLSLDVSVLRPSQLLQIQTDNHRLNTNQVENWGVNRKKGVIEWEHGLRELEGVELGGRGSPVCVNGYSSI